MKKEDAVTLAACAGVTFYGVGYLCAAFLEWPTLTYFPHERAWRIVTHAPAAPMAYYGLVLWGLIFGVNAASIVHALATHVLRRPLSRGLAGLCAGWTFSSLLLAVAYFTYQSWP